MSQITLSINFDLSSKLDLMNIVNREVFPLLHQAVGGVAQQTAINWQKAVLAAKLSPWEKDKYSQSVTWQMTGDFTAMVESSYDKAAEIESGRPPRDLKKMLGTSLKVRQGKKGRYLYIPFRHNTPGNNALAASMPDDVYGLAKRLSPSSIKSVGTRPSQQTGKTHLTVPERKYSWGSRLPAGLSPKMKPHHKTDIHAGMYRFNTSTPGGGKSSAYLTFRTMSEKSTGWIIPAQPGLNLASGVVSAMQPKAVAAFEMAIKQTLSAQ